jgi:hypothetical protein
MNEGDAAVAVFRDRHVLDTADGESYASFA